MLLDARTTVVRILFMICWVAIFDHVIATHLRTTRTAHPRKNSANSFHACKLAKPKALTDDSLAALADADQSQMPLASFKIEAPAKTGGRHINVCYVCNWSRKNGVGACSRYPYRMPFVVPGQLGWEIFACSSNVALNSASACQ